MKNKKVVLITGISGWIALYCAIDCIKNGYKVKGSLRDMSRIKEVEKALSQHVDIKDNLEFCELDLLHDAGWDEAMSGCEFLMHIASPFVVYEPKNPNELIEPALEGTLRALHAAHKAKVKRVVITSSIVSMGAHLTTGKITPSSWTELDDKYKVNTYQKSKTIAEKAAWEFYANQPKGHKFEMTVVNPGGVMGPALTEDIESASLDIFVQLLTGKMPGIPYFRIPMVDVRDVADHHLKAMEHPDADGKRFISASAEPIDMMDLALTLKENGFKVPTKRVPSFLLKLLSFIDPQAKAMTSLIDKAVGCDNQSTIKMFNWTPMNLNKTFIEMANSIQEKINKN